MKSSSALGLVMPYCGGLQTAFLTAQKLGTGVMSAAQGGEAEGTAAKRTVHHQVLRTRLLLAIVRHTKTMQGLHSVSDHLHGLGPRVHMAGDFAALLYHHRIDDAVLRRRRRW